MITTMPLPFPADGLEPDISGETFEHHHGRHFQAYIDKVNELIAGTAHAGRNLETIIRHAADAGETGLFNAAGQTWNHGFFWASLSPATDTRPGSALAAAITRDFGSFDAMAAQFITTGAGQFGSGWAWLVADADGRLALQATHDAMPAWIERAVTPLLVCDVWEHAYYIDWRNDRGGFLKTFINSRANWALADGQYAAATGGGTAWRYPA